MSIESLKTADSLFARGLGSGITTDAWGTQKVGYDYSLLSALFTFELSNRQVKIFENGAEVLGNENSTRASSQNGALFVSSGLNDGDITRVESLRHPRYQANRGHHYGVSEIAPNTANGSIVRYGLGTVDNRVYFEIESDIIYCCIKSNGVLKKRERVYEPFSINKTKGNIFDIQFQWRGVGDYFFYAGDKEDANVKLLKRIRFLGETEELSIENPAMPFFFESENVGGNEAVLKCGCVDISSEGGKPQSKERVSPDTDGEVTVSGSDIVILVAHVPNTFKGKINTRDFELVQIIGSSDQRVILRTYTTRDASAFNGTLPVPIQLKDSSLIYYRQPTPTTPTITFDSTKGNSIGSIRIPSDDTKALKVKVSKDLSTYATAGDYIVVVGSKVQQNAIVGANIILGEEV